MEKQHNYKWKKKNLSIKQAQDIVHMPNVMVDENLI